MLTLWHNPGYYHLVGIHSDGPQQKPWKPRPNLTLGGLVRDFRQAHGLLHAQIAEDWGVSKMHIWKIERGKCMPSRALTIIISRWMGLDENLGLIMAGYFPWTVGIEHARKVCEIVTGSKK